MSNERTVDLTFPAILHGGDYNPEQWPESIWDVDIDLMKRAGVNTATLPVFGWGNIQLDEENWDWAWLDKAIDKLHSGGIKLCLATATAATPPWVDAKYPDILRVESDGRRRKHGSRHTFCPSSPDFRRLSTGLARKMAERYGHHPALLVWHVSNEYGGQCFCELCSAGFRDWLKAKYGTLDELNFRWNMAFWGQTYTEWSQIEAPTDLAQRNFQGLLVDYDRFQSEAILNCCRAEIDVLREITPHIPITTNMMGTFKTLDYHKWAKALDIVSWDSYPARSAKPYEIAFRHALMRGLKEGQPWMLMEQTPSQQNWQAYNSLKRPGVMRLWSYQAMAHGADAIMYFQWRRSPGAQEMFHGAVVEHAGTSEARVFREVAELGQELKSLGRQTLGARVKADVAIVFDWENWWAVEYSSGPSADLKYVPNCLHQFQALFELGITADVVSPEADLSGYKLVIAPVLKMMPPNFPDKIQRFVEEGGKFVTTYFSGIVDGTDRAFPNGYPGPLRDLLGIWVEETDALAPTERNRAVFCFSDAPAFSCGLLCDRIHLRGAEAIAMYGDDFYADEPVVTRHRVGAGEAYYLGSLLDAAGLRHFYKSLGLSPTLVANPIEEVEIVCRALGAQEQFYVLNHNRTEVRVFLPEGEFTDLLTGRKVREAFDMPGYGVAILHR
jgi:beta-galactosidase